MTYYEDCKEYDRMFSNKIIVPYCGNVAIPDGNTGYTCLTCLMVVGSIGCPCSEINVKAREAKEKQK